MNGTQPRLGAFLSGLQQKRMTPAMTMQIDAAEPKHVLTLDRVLDASVAKLWRCWTEPELLKQWISHNRWYVYEERMDLRPGGEFYTLMNGPDGERIPNLGVFLEIRPVQRLVTTDAFRPGWVPNDQAFMVADMGFESVAGGKTRYQARAMHWTAEAMRQHEEMGFHPGWNAAADQLEALAQSL